MSKSEIRTMSDADYSTLLTTHPKINGDNLIVGKNYWVFGDPFMRKYEDPTLITFVRRDESGMGNTNKNVYGKIHRFPETSIDDYDTKFSYTRENMTFYESNEINDEWVKKLTEKKGGKSRKSNKSRKSKKSKKSKKSRKSNKSRKTRKH